MRAEKRNAKRIPIDIFVNKYIDGEPHVCRAVNISPGGMLLYKVFEPSVPQEEVSLEFQLPGLRHILRVDGITLAEHPWARAHCVRFTKMADEDRMLIERFLSGDLEHDRMAFI